MKLVLCLVLLPVVASATGVSTAIFPALRKRLEQKKLAAVQQGTKTSKTQVPATSADEKQAQDVPSAAVPAPLDANADGYPELPAVSQMLSAASGTLKSVNSQASGLEARVVQAQMQSETKMAKQKAAFEEKLKQQEQGNQAVIAANAKITEEIKALKSGNAALKKHSHEIEENNKLMRSELKTLQARLGVAKDFVAKSLTSTDDSKSSLLQVLRGGRKHHRSFVETASSTKKDNDDDNDNDNDNDDEGDDEEDDDNDDEGTSFLALSSKVNRASIATNDGASSFEAAMSELEAVAPADAPEMGPAMPNVPAASPSDLLSILSKDVANLVQQEKESEKNLKNLFIRDFRSGAKRHQALLAQQKTLVATRTSLQDLQTKLNTAKAHLEATQSQLESRLHGLGQYLQKLAHFAMAPQHEVPHLLEVLPKTVVMKTESKKTLL